MENKKYIDLKSFNKKLNLTSDQKKMISDTLEFFITKNSFETSNSNSYFYFNGLKNGLNICYKIINNIDDDYNSK